MRKVTREQRNLGEWVENAAAFFHNTKIFIESNNSRIRFLELSNAMRQISLDFELKSDEFGWYKRPCRPYYTRAQFEFSQNMYIEFVPHSINMLLFFSFLINVQCWNGRGLFMLYVERSLTHRFSILFLYTLYLWHAIIYFIQCVTVVFNAKNVFKLFYS